MGTLIVGKTNLAKLWGHHINDAGMRVDVVKTNDDAAMQLRTCSYRVVVLDLEGDTEDNAFALTDYACVRQPEAQVVFVADKPSLLDGSLFRFCVNMGGLLSKSTPPGDLAALVGHLANTGDGRKQVSGLAI
ncbi:MAG: hypothetical protein ACU0BK_07750 [Shimia sp.]|uniref:hypothetical protein n=1 Tax=Shimia sp. TaxID=1954381 RepID=UPI00405810A2